MARAWRMVVAIAVTLAVFFPLLLVIEALSPVAGLAMDRGLASTVASVLDAVFIATPLWVWAQATTRRRRMWKIPRPDPADIARPALTDQVVAQLATAEGDTVALTAALVGAGGFGKTTLAKLVADDRRVRRAFWAGVWTTLGQDVTAGDLAGKINGIYEQLTGTRPGFTDPDQAGQHLGELLHRGGRVLLVIDDVWRTDQLRPFLHTGQRATRLVTTRRPGVLPAHARDRMVKVDRLDEPQARQVLTADLPPITHKILARLLKVTGRWPLLLRLANAHLRETLSRTGTPADQAAAQLADRLERDGPHALDLADEASRDQAAAASINASLTLLAPTPTDPIDARPLFMQLAVFAEDADIELAVLGVLWHRAGLDDGKVERVCERLYGLSLVADYQPGRSLRLHDVIHAYLQTETRPHLPHLHATLLDAAATLLPQPASLSAALPWWQLPEQAHYLRQHLCEHLHHAARHAQLHALLSDLRWAETRIRHDGPAALDADLHHSTDPTLTTLRRAITQNAHLLTPPSTAEPRWTADNLLDQLTGTPGIDHLIDAYRQTLPPAIGDKPRTPPANRPHPALRRVLTGHTAWVASCAIAPDGTWLATTSGDRTARIWDTTTGTLRHTLKGHTGSVGSCAIAPDGTWLATTSDDRTARIWDTTTGTLRHTLKRHTGSVRSCAIAPDGTWLATTSDDHTARIWDTTTGTLRHTLKGHTSTVYSCAIAPDGTWLATTSGDRTTRIWDTTTGTLRHTLKGHTLKDHTIYVRSCAIAPDGTWLATTSRDDTAQIWDTTTGTLRHTLKGHTGSVHSCAIAPDGTWLATTSDDPTTRIWDTTTGTLRHTLKGHDTPVHSCAIARDGTWLATTSWDHTARIWDTTTGTLRHTLNGHTGPVYSCAIAPDGTWLATISHDRTARIWDTTG